MICPKCKGKVEMESKGALFNMVWNQCPKCKNIEIDIIPKK